jgi:hypothetical protein
LACVVVSWCTFEKEFGSDIYNPNKA